MFNILNIQDSNFEDSLTIDEAVKVCMESEDITVMYGAYAFVSTDGFKLMFGDSKRLEKIKNISLIVGMDSITNSACIEHLTNEIDHDLFNISAYMSSNKTNSLFHPKFCFMTNEKKSLGWLILGSGNLTFSGLRKNKEAFSGIKLSSNEVGDVLKTWEKWVKASAFNLKGLEEQAVKIQAEKNDRLFKGKNKPSGSSASSDEELYYNEQKAFNGWFFDRKAEVLIAEIPRGGKRWKQANFDKDTYLGYFAGSLKTSQKEVVLRHVNERTGKLEEIENRPCVAVKSQNYRVELAAAGGQVYPEQGAPIAIFINVGKRTFIYTLFVPSNKYYSVLREWVNIAREKENIKGNKKLRLVLPFSDLESLLKPTKLARYYEEESDVKAEDLLMLL